MTASSEVPNVLTVALQPVCFSNGVTQSTLGSLLPFSAYPGQARMETAPSPAPSLSSWAIFGGVKPDPPAAQADYIEGAYQVVEAAVDAAPRGPGGPA